MPSRMRLTVCDGKPRERVCGVHMLEFDSRALTNRDRFVQQFFSVGQIQYGVAVAGNRDSVAAYRQQFTIDVMPRPSRVPEPRQHTVIIRRDGSIMAAQPAELEIVQGDVVSWHTPVSVATGCVIRGTGPDGPFDSSALTRAAIYLHTFYCPGEYCWADANQQTVSGVVIVQQVNHHNPAACQAWKKSLRTGVRIRVRGNDVDPTSLCIAAGQAVLWVIEQASGISVTDARLFAHTGQKRIAQSSPKPGR